MKPKTVSRETQVEPAQVEPPAAEPAQVAPPAAEPAQVEPAQVEPSPKRGRPPVARRADGSVILDPGTGRKLSARDPRAASLGAVNAESETSAPAESPEPAPRMRRPRAAKESVAAATAPAPGAPTAATLTAEALAAASLEAGRRKIAVAAPSLHKLLAPAVSRGAASAMSTLGGPDLATIRVTAITTQPVLGDGGAVVAGRVEPLETSADDALARALCEVAALYLPQIPDAPYAPAVVTALAVAVGIASAWGNAPRGE